MLQKLRRWNMRACLQLIVLGAVLLAWPAASASGRDSGRGRLIEYRDIAVPGLPAQRLTIWLPPGYDTGRERFPVLYMQDGHNLFDLANSNFNKIWAADRAMLAAVRKARIKPHIIVGIWAPGADRWRQYLPADIHRAAPPATRAAMERMGGGPVVSDRYVDWLSGPLKSWIDTQFRTLPGRDHTAIMGSSMGGLVSCYAFLRRPDVYGRAACISSHWPAVDPRAVESADQAALIALWDQWFAQGLGPAQGRRLWLDHGTTTLDAYYAPYQQAVDQRIAQLGWRRGVDWQSKVYPGAPHEENAWAARLPEVLGWLLAPKN